MDVTIVTVTATITIMNMMADADVDTAIKSLTIMRNTFGNIFTLTTFGESHGTAIGGVVDGMPAGIEIDMAFIQQELNRYTYRVYCKKREPALAGLREYALPVSSVAC